MTRRKKGDDLLEQRTLLDGAAIAGALGQMTDAVLARNPDPTRVVVVGIRTGGVHLAERMRKLIEERTKKKPLSGVLDITLYRDDVFVGLPRPVIGPTELPLSLDGLTLVLVDDVLYTGRTVRAALVELLDFGRPERVELAALVDRGHRELPIEPNYVGLRVETTREESVLVSLTEAGDAADKVALFRRAP